jgi:hypothetical protein
MMSIRSRIKPRSILSAAGIMAVAVGVGALIHWAAALIILGLVTTFVAEWGGNNA